MFSIRDLDIYYEDCVIGGPGAFNLVVQTPENFARAIRAKLLLEIAGIPPAPASGPRAGAASVEAQDPRPPRARLPDRGSGFWRQGMGRF